MPSEDDRKITVPSFFVEMSKDAANPPAAHLQIRHLIQFCAFLRSPF
jgi:hypothetical protein